MKFWVDSGADMTNCLVLCATFHKHRWVHSSTFSLHLNQLLMACEMVGLVLKEKRETWYPGTHWWGGIWLGDAGSSGQTHPWKELGWILLVLWIEGSQKTSNFLIDSFYLADGFWLVSRLETDRDWQFFHEIMPDSGGELGATITDNVLWDPIVSEHMIWKLNLLFQML